MSRTPAAAPPRRRSLGLLLGGGLVIGLLAVALVSLGDPDPYEGMVWIEGGTFRMGRDPAQCDSSLCALPGQKDSLPIHEVEIDGFWMDRTPVTNAQFEKFVRATGYKTVAERPMPFRTPEGDLIRVPWGIVFTPPDEPIDDLTNSLRWWKGVRGADWRHPEGPDSDITKRMDHPVVQVAWEDAVAYCRWAGKRLPTEAEFEYAARGGQDGQRFVWGDEQKPGGRWVANIWQGKFPHENTQEDGYRGTSPVTAFPPNGYGLHDLSGNVWQWCSDWYRPDYYEMSPRTNPRGPSDSFDPSEPGVAKRVQRGGSFLCSDLYCQGYQPGSRHKNDPLSCANHCGFRCVRDRKR